MLDAKRMLLIGAAVAAILALPLAARSAPAHHPPTGAADESDRYRHVPAETRALLRQARRATRVYRDVAAARTAGYAQAGACAEDPKYGAMGIHYENPRYVSDGVLDLTRPELLVYQPTRSGKLRLGALEYFQVDADQDLATDTDRPWLFGMPFDGPMLGHSTEMPIHYDLHVWLYRHNPAGRFAMWNPSVRCPSAPGSHAAEGRRTR